MIEKLQSIAGHLIWFSYLALAVVTPLIFSTKNSELFEVPKMHFVYFVAVIILFLTLVKFILQGRIIIPQSWPLLALLTFLTILTLSTFFSIDKFTSVFGYPSRLNGGLLAQFAYFVIFSGVLINLSSLQIRKLLVAIVLTALAVSLWGVPGHFGRDPSCFVLTGRLTSDCWQKEFDPTLRIFSTLGQHNWLASYLVLVLPIAIALILTATPKTLKVFFLATSMLLYMALVLTTSRAGLLGLALTAIVFLPFMMFSRFKTGKQNLLLLGFLLVGIVIITTLFGRFLFARLGEVIGKNKPTVTSNQSPATTQQTAIGGTESSTIRLIVWKGAIEAFKAKPILGFGPETFAYAYYRFRPLAHNQTTEWNFFYNKAHNEFLNLAATTGVLGTLAFVAFLTLALAAIYRQRTNPKNPQDRLIPAATIAAVLGYQTSIFFGFSTVAAQLVMYLLIAGGLTTAASTREIEIG